MSKKAYSFPKGLSFADVPFHLKDECDRSFAFRDAEADAGRDTEAGIDAFTRELTLLIVTEMFGGKRFLRIPRHSASRGYAAFLKRSIRIFVAEHKLEEQLRLRGSGWLYAPLLKFLADRISERTRAYSD